MANDPRRHRRTGIDRHCWIAPRDGGAAIECIVADVSETGAKIVVQPGVKLAEQFDLHFTRDGKVSFKSKVVWRKDGEVGLEFVGRPRALRH